MIIRKAEKKELEEILTIYKEAREYMALNGNKDQWGDNYPPRELIEEDIASGKCYIAVDEKICGVFYFDIEVARHRCLPKWHQKLRACCRPLPECGDHTLPSWSAGRWS